MKWDVKAKKAYGNSKTFQVDAKDMEGAAEMARLYLLATEGSDHDYEVVTITRE
jgi:hypothetical protein